MSSAFAEANVLEMGTNANQVPPVVAEAAIPDGGQSDKSGDSDGQGSRTIASPVVEEEEDLDPGQ